MTWNVRHLTQTIAADPSTVAAIAGNPANLPRWAAGLSGGIRQEGDRWFTDAPFGMVEVRFVGPVDLGILDHDVVMPDGSIVHNPLRVMPNDDGSEVVLSLFQRTSMTDDEFEADTAAVRADLQRLRDLVEGGPAQSA